MLCMHLVVVFCVFFFFQAEDGIRDYKVTGVQTCALPIFGGIATAIRALKPEARIIGVETRGADVMSQSLAAGKLVELPAIRSEERRVGKECRCRWWRDE